MKKRLYITIILLLATILVAFGLPKPKYTSPDILGKLNVPYSLRNWRSEDASNTIKQQKDDKYNFISDIFARIYGTRYGDSLLFIILDAGNFHHPKVCFGSSGYKIKELEETQFTVPKGQFKAKTLLALKGDTGYVLVYWMVINKKKVNWTEQKIKQLWFSLLNRDREGLMMRLDIPVTDSNPKAAISIAQRFIADISREMSTEDQEHVFGIHD